MGLGHRVRMAICLFVGIATSMAGYSLMVFAGFVLLVQCLRLLQDGLWTDYQFRLAWEYVGLTEEPLSAHSVEEIRTWILDQPLSIGVFLCGLASWYVGATFMRLEERLAAEKPQNRRDER